MDNDEFVKFLKGTLIKIENVVNLIGQDVPKHIPAYNKMLGVQQKLGGMDRDRKAQLFPQMIATRTVLNYLMNGRYDEAFNHVKELRANLIKICWHMENNERNTNK